MIACELVFESRLGAFVICVRISAVVRIDFTYALFRLVHVFDIAFEHEQIRGRPSIDLQCAAIVPLDRAFNFLAILQHEHHGCVRIDLFLVVIDFCVSFSWRWLPLAHLHWLLPRSLLRHAARSPSAALLWISILLRNYVPPRFDVSQGCSDKFSIHNTPPQGLRRARTRPE